MRSLRLVIVQADKDCTTADQKKGFRLRIYGFTAIDSLNQGTSQSLHLGFRIGETLGKLRTKNSLKRPQATKRPDQPTPAVITCFQSFSSIRHLAVRALESVLALTGYEGSNPSFSAIKQKAAEPDGPSGFLFMGRVVIRRAPSRAFARSRPRVAIKTILLGSFCCARVPPSPPFTEDTPSHLIVRLLRLCGRPWPHLSSGQTGARAMLALTSPAACSSSA